MQYLQSDFCISIQHLISNGIREVDRTHEIAGSPGISQRTAVKAPNQTSCLIENVKDEGSECDLNLRASMC